MSIEQYLGREQVIIRFDTDFLDTMVSSDAKILMKVALNILYRVLIQ